MDLKNFVPKTPEPKDYFSAYQRRLERNDWQLKELAKEVMLADKEVEVYFHHDESRYQSAVIFFKGENINSISFHETPYHWSGCGVKSHNGGEDNISMPFTVEDVLTTFEPVTNILFRQPKEFFKSKEQYLNWCSYCKKFEV